MAYYNNDASQWNAPGRQSSWEQPPPPSRSGASSTVQREEPSAFQTQFEEVDRAADNLLKSGKMFGPGSGPPSRRDSMPVMAGRGYPPDFTPSGPGGPPGGPSGPNDPRMGGPQRHHSISDYDGARPSSASNLQGYYANQRFGPRPNDADSMMQAKRRMAAQRERELRNYHQEQQYNRNASGAKSDRSLSPNAMSEEDRRELIARQHRALYGENSQLYTNDGSGQRQSSQDARIPTSAGGRGHSPLAFDPFGSQGQSGNNDGAVQMPPRDSASNKDTSAGAQRSRANSTSSPSSNNPNTSFNLYENAQQSSRTSNSSPGGSPPLQGNKAPTSSGVAPIGTRPSQGQGSTGGAMNKRSTTPLPSPLGFGYSASENNNNNERSTSASSNPSSGAADKGVSLGWGNNSGVWGNSKNTLGVQASVWG